MKLVNIAGQIRRFPPSSTRCSSLALISLLMACLMDLPRFDQSYFQLDFYLPFPEVPALQEIAQIYHKLLCAPLRLLAQYRKSPLQAVISSRSHQLDRGS